MDWTTRRVTPNDADAVRTLRLEMLATCPDVFFVDAEYWRSRDAAFWAAFAQRAATAIDEAIFLAFIADRSVAMAHAKLTEGTAEFGMQYVAPDARSRGIGTALIAEREAWAARNGATHAQCSIVIDNTASETLHEAAGWIATDDIHLERAATGAAPAVYERRWHKPLTR